MPRSLVILGAGRHGQHLAGMLDGVDHAYREVVFLDDRSELAGRTVAGCQVVGAVERLAAFSADDAHFLVGAGNRSMADRGALFARGAAAGLTAPCLAHRSSYRSPRAEVGTGTVLFPLSVVNPFAELGRNCVIYTGASVEHHCRLGDNVWLSPGAHLGGNVVIGRDSFLGVGASVSADVRIGANCLIGAGTVVLHDVPDGTVWVGVPGRQLRRNRP